MSIKWLAATCLLVLGAQAQADVAKGKQLHDQNCISCHVNISGGDGTALYTRANRRVNNMAQLEAQVRRCEANVGAQWFDEDIEAVVDYLNTNYYKLSSAK